ncbi:MAG: HEAT repeat domain-containing protein [bacterium]|nr:HEAT repeat domain-containing protein [bacterium]
MTVNGVVVPHEASVADLAAMLKLPPPECWAAMKALGIKSTQESLDVLAAQISSDDPYVRRAALEAVGDHSDGTCLEGQVLKCFDDTSQLVVRQACATAATLGLASGHDQVAALLEAPSEATRCKAIAAISVLWKSSDFDMLVKLYCNDHENSVRKDAAWVLYEHVTSDTCRRLFELYCADSIPRHRGWACELCARFKMSGVDGTLERLTQDSDGHVRSAAQAALDG